MAAKKKVQYDESAIQTLDALEAQIGDLEEGAKAIKELRELLAFTQNSASGPILYIDPYLARGLSYYTGPIFEIAVEEGATAVRVGRAVFAGVDLSDTAPSARRDGVRPPAGREPS